MKKVLILLTLASAIQASQILAQEGEDKPKESKEIDKENHIKNLLKLAAIKGDKETINSLLENSSNIIDMQTKKDALKFAIEYNHELIVLQLINDYIAPYAGYNNEQNQDLLEYWALYFAAQYNRENIVKLLLDITTIPQHDAVFQSAVLDDNLDIVKLFLNSQNFQAVSDEAKINALHTAISKNNEILIKLLLFDDKYFNEINNKNMKEYLQTKPFVSAIENGSIIKLLLSNNNKYLQEKALEFAAEYGYEQIIRIQLINDKINVNMRIHALKIAAKNHKQDIINILLSNNNKYIQEQALELAAEHGYKNIIETQLLYSKLNSNMKNHALKIAAKNNHQDIVKLLQNNLSKRF